MEYKIRAKQAPILTRELKRGCQGDDVILLQQRLLDIGFDLGYYGADGYFGGVTQDKLNDLLVAYGLKPEGKVTQDIWVLLFGEHAFAQFNNKMFKCLCGKYCDGYYKGGINPAIKILLARIQSAMRKQLGYTDDVCLVVKSNKTAYPGNGGYRCKRWNQRRGGATYSQHLYAKAADVYPAIGNIPAAEYFDLLFECADQCNPYGGVGIGTHTNRYMGVCHVDVRGRKSRWAYAR